MKEQADSRMRDFTSEFYHRVNENIFYLYYLLFYVAFFIDTIILMPDTFNLVILLHLKM